ncbi:hypothetical protein UY3_14432 [Chelonia mydas]|uniref:Uncharacterized protein n=1 Tax=Chelonia mydas TaxID=8469 RepID=M7B8G8_CHEMY|nr:hypothetical protein UY3_14432 [Chelonia mydas]
MAIPYHVILTSALLPVMALPSELGSRPAAAALQLLRSSSEGSAAASSSAEYKREQPSSFYSDRGGEKTCVAGFWWELSEPQTTEAQANIQMVMEAHEEKELSGALPTNYPGDPEHLHTTERDDRYKAAQGNQTLIRLWNWELSVFWMDSCLPTGRYTSS